MTDNSGLTIHKGAAALIALSLLVTGAAGSYLLMQGKSSSTSQQGKTATVAVVQASATPTENSKAGTPLPDVVVSLSAEAVHRAGIVVTPVSSAASGTSLRLPGVVEPNAYKQIAVTPLVAGRITRVSAALGDHVRQGQTLAQIYSPQLAEAQTRYVSGRAM